MKTIKYFFPAVLFGFAFLSANFVGTWGCGGGGGAGGESGGLSIQANVAAPTTSALSVSSLAVGDRIGTSGSKRITEETAAGVECHAEDLEGNEIGTPCTTDDSGSCEITGLTADQIAAGVVIVTETGMHDLVFASDEEIADAEAGTPVPSTVNTESDMTYAVVTHECSDDLAGCGATIDLDALEEATMAVVGDDDPSADNLGGYAEAVLEAHATAIEAGTGDRPPAELLEAALEGDPSAITAIVGESVSDVPVADAVTNFGAMVTEIVESYCDPETATWDTVKAEGGEEFDPKAIVGIFKGFTSTEISEYEPEDFRGFAAALPDLLGGFTMFGAHDEARRALVEQFRLGAFADPTKAGPALGMLAATFPPPPSEGDFRGIDFSGFDPSVGARAANNGFLEYVGSATSFANAGDIYSKFNSTLSDSTYRQSWATGGSAACADFIAGFVANPGEFVPGDFIATIKVPPGGSCTSSDDCLPCDTCKSGVCTSLSTKMGLSCTTNDDCDEVTTCVGAYISGFGGHCMCTAGVPTGAFVHSGEGSGPLAFGATDGYAPPPAGGEGSPCGTGFSPCLSGLSCTDPLHGVCVSSTFKKAPYAPCSSGSECESGSCTSGLCAAFTADQLSTFSSDGTTIGLRANGQPCATGSECASFFCSAGICASPPTEFGSATTGTGLKADGSSCTLSSECASFFCSGGICTASSGFGTGSGTGTGTPTGLPPGSFCLSNSECQSASCNLAMHMCN